MKRTVPPQARQRLVEIVQSGMPMEWKGSESQAKTIEAIVEWYESQNTFTDVITSDSKEEKMCPLCDRLYIMNNRKFLSLWVLVLQVLIEKPMTMTEVDAELHKMGLVNGSGVTSTVKYGVLMRHWGVIEQTDIKRKGAKVYAITKLGRDFIAGLAKIPSHVWLSPHGVVEGKENKIAKMVQAHEIESDDADEISDRKKYVDEGQSAFGA